MNRNEFFNYVVENVRIYLPPTFEGAQISVAEIEKENGRRISVLLIRRQEDTSIPRISLEESYGAYMEGDSLDKCVERIADLRMQCDNLEFLSDLGYVKDYEKIKDKLTIKLCDPELNQRWLEDKVYTLHGDFAAVYYVVIREGEEESFNMPVSKTLLEEWKVTLKQIHEDALLSDKEKQPVLFSLEDYVRSMLSGSRVFQNLLDEETECDFEMVKMPVLGLTNSRIKNGASMIIQKDIMKRVGEIIGSDFYVLPSSIHEVLFVPDIGIADLEGLSLMVKEINETKVELCDKLSNKVQYYERAKGKLENAERRNQMKSSVISNQKD